MSSRIGNNFRTRTKVGFKSLVPRTGRARAAHSRNIVQNRTQCTVHSEAFQALPTTRAKEPVIEEADLEDEDPTEAADWISDFDSE